MIASSSDVGDSQTTLMVPSEGFDESEPASLPARPQARPAALEAVGLTAARRLGRYVLLGALGRGGMGQVLEAFDPGLDRRVAIKVLHPSDNPQHDQRMVREAQALAKLSHPNVVQVYEVGETEGRLFVAMELVRGQTLSQWARQRPAPDWRRCVEVYRQAGEGLAAAHAEGLVHRDFKPDNAMIDDAGRVRVLDFGLARSVDHDQACPSTPIPELDETMGTVHQSITQTGVVIGTPAYMSPEQLTRRHVDAKSDQFSFCVALYEAIWGERPFAGDTVPALRESVAGGALRPVPRSPVVPDALARALHRGMATQPQQRWPDMEALLAELRDIVSPPRSASRSLALGAGLLAAGLLVWRSVDDDPAGAEAPCQGAQAQLDGVWDSPRRDEAREAILRAAGPLGPETWSRVEATLDDHADRWVAEHTDACEATSVRREQSSEVLDLRMGCLERQRIAMREAVTVLHEADPARAREAVNLVSGLDEAERCRDIEALRAQLPPPSDPETARRVAAQRERLARVISLYATGDYDRGLAEAEAVVEQAESIGYAPLIAEARLRRGQMRHRKGAAEESVADLEAAYLLAAEHRHHQVEAVAAVELANTVGGMQSRHEPGLQWGRLAVALGRGLHEDPGIEAHALNALGRIENVLGHLEKAQALFEQAVALTERIHGPDHPEISMKLNNLGIVLAQRGELSESLEVFERALAIKRAAYGPSHPEVATTLENIGNVLGMQQRYEQSIERYQQALEIKRTALGEQHLLVGMALDNIGATLADLGQLERAREHHEKALEVFEAAVGRQSLHTARAANNLGVALERQGHIDQALEQYRFAADTWTATLGPEHSFVGTATCNVGRMLRRQGKLDEAWAALERARTIDEAALGPEHPQVADALVAQADVALARGELATARERAERALTIAEAAEVPASGMAEVRFVLARALASDPEATARARELGLRAHEGFVEAGEGFDESREDVERWLAEQGIEPEAAQTLR